MYIGEAWKTTSPHVGKGISLRIRYNVRDPDSGNRQIFASGIRNPRSSAQEIRRNPETRNPENCTGNPGSTTWNSDHPRLSWIYLTLSEELTNVFVNAYTPYFSRSTPLSLFNIAVPTPGNLWFFTKHQWKWLKRSETLSTYSLHFARRIARGWEYLFIFYWLLLKRKPWV